jgi:hypothetical protein
VAKQSRRRHLAAEPQHGRRQVERGTAGRRMRLAIVAGLVAVLAIVITAGAVAVGAAFGTSTQSAPPPGTMVFPENDHSHVEGTVKYDRVPPAGGPHNPIQLNCGIYTVAVPNENAVHSLEHGAVWITYEPNLPAAEVAALEQLVRANYVTPEKYLILSPYSGLPAPIVASAWGAQLYAQNPSDPNVLAFIHYYAGGSQGGEPGGPCTGGVGNPIQ